MSNGETDPELNLGAESLGAFRKWRSTNTFVDTAGDSAPESVHSRSSSMGSLDGISPGAGQDVTAADKGRLVRAMSTISIIQPIASGADVDFDMYRPRHSTAKWNPV